MSMYRRYNYRAYPTRGQREALSRLYGACRYAYNWTLDQRELMRRRHGRMQSYTQLSGMFTQWKTNPGMEWLLAVSSTPLQQSIRHADVAYRNFLRLYKAGRTHIVTTAPGRGIARDCPGTRAAGTANSPPSSPNPRDSRSGMRTDANGAFSRFRRSGGSNSVGHANCRPRRTP